MSSFVDWLARLPAGALFLTVLGVTLLVALGCAWVAERIFDPEARGLSSGSVTTAVGVMAAIYSVLVAFVIVNEWAAFSDAQSTVSSESAAPVATYSSAIVLPQPGSSAIQRAILNYDRTLVCSELPRLQTHDGPSPTSVAALRTLFTTIAANPSDSPFYSNVCRR